VPAAVSAANGIVGVGDTFDAEVVDTIEAGVKGEFLDGRLRGNLSVYRSEAEGTYFFIFLAANSTQNLGNLKEVEYQGLELDLSAVLNDHWSLSSGLGITDSEITDSENPSDIGTRAPNVSRYTFNLGLNYERPLSALSNGVEFFARMEYQIIGNTSFFDNEQPGRTNNRDDVHLADFRVGLQLPQDWTLTAWAKNAFNEEYNAEYSTGGFVFKAPPRRWGVDFMKRF
jgi:iron complex outermembrane receptor protein